MEGSGNIYITSNNLCKGLSKDGPTKSMFKQQFSHYFLEIFMQGFLGDFKVIVFMKLVDVMLFVFIFIYILSNQKQ